MIYLLTRKISFPLMTLVMVQYLRVLVSALHSYCIKDLFLYLIHMVVIEMVTIFPWPISSLRISFSKSPKSIHYKLFWEKFSKCNIFSVWCSVYENCSIRNWSAKYFRIIEAKKIVGSWRVVPKEKKTKLSKSNSDKAVLSLLLKRTDDKAENVFKGHNSVNLTKSSDGDKIKLHEYILHNKERIGQQHKDYYNKRRFLKKILKRFRSNSKK